MFKTIGSVARRAAAPVAMSLGLAVIVQLPAGALPLPVGLGTATSFAVLAGAGITNTGATTLTGDAGTFPTPAETGFNGPAPDQVTFLGGGVDHAGDAVTQGAKADLVTAYDDAAGRLPEISHAVELGGDTLTPGVYSNGTFGVTGALTLDFQGDLTASFIFKTASTLITAVDSSVVMVNVAPGDADAACRVTWKVGSSATFDTGTDFIGDVLAKESITANTGASFIGRLLARDGAVTLDTNTIDRGSCAALAPTPTGGSGGGGGGGGGGLPVVTPTTSTSTTSTTVRARTTSTTSTPLRPVVPADGSTAAPPTDDGSSTGAPVPAPSGPTGPVGGPPASPPAGGRPNPPELPLTGTGSVSLALIGAGAIVAGALTMVAARRRST